jgi:ribose/xylose/arabinose/galactoside ABC-type transport system permease subunit
MARAPTHGGHGMTAIGRAFSRAIVTLNDNEILKQLALLCAAGLFVSLLMLTYGIDLSPGFF